MTKEETQTSREFLYVMLLAAVQISHIVDFVVLMPLGPTLMKELNITPVEFAGLVSSYNYAAATSGIIVAIIADRYVRKHLLILSLVGFTLATLACANASNFQFLLIARIITGAFGGVLGGIVFAFVADIIPFSRRGKAMGIVMSSFSISSVLGVPLGLTISDFFGWRATFYSIAVFSTVVGVTSYIVFPATRDHMIKDNAKVMIKKMLRIFTNLYYLKSFTLIFFIGMSMFLIIPFLSPYAVKNIGIEIYELKYMYLTAGAFTVITAQIFGRLTDKLGPFKLFVILSTMGLVPIYLYTNAGQLALFWYLAMSVLFMVIISGRMIPCMTLISAIPSSSDRGSFMSILNSIRSLGSATATLIAGLIITDTEHGLVGFSTVGYLSIFMTLFTIFLAFQVKLGLLSKRD